MDWWIALGVFGVGVMVGMFVMALCVAAGSD